MQTKKVAEPATNGGLWALEGRNGGLGSDGIHDVGTHPVSHLLWMGDSDLQLILLHVFFLQEDESHTHMGRMMPCTVTTWSAGTPLQMISLRHSTQSVPLAEEQVKWFIY